MKKIIFLSLLLAIACSNNIASQTFTLLESYSLSDIEAQAGSLGIPSAFFTPDNGVDFYSVVYETVHPNGDTIDVSGAVCIPQTINCDLPMATYQHGTVFTPEDVPSNLNDESLIGLLYASKGYIVPMPDYIGLGVSAEYIHPYVHAESEAQAGLDLLRAVRDEQETLDYSWNEQLFIYGYSQGGHAAAALQRKIETEFSEEFTVTASVPMSGPYDLSGAQTDFVLSGAEYPTPGYLPYLILGYQDVYGGLFTDLEDILLPQYATIIQQYIDGAITLGQAQAGLPAIPGEMLQPDFLVDFTTNPDHPLMLAIQDNDLLDWAPQAPTRIIYCNADDQVAPQNSVNALEVWEANGAVALDGVDGGNFDHGGCVLPALLGGLFFFDQYAIHPITFTAEFTVTSSEIGLENGAAQAIVISDDETTVIWEDGTEGESISGLAPGSYTVEVISESGCGQEFTIEVDSTVGIRELIAPSFSAYPNPASESVTLEFNTVFSGDIVVLDMQGKVMIQKTIESSDSFVLPVLELAQGFYLIKVGDTAPLVFIKE